MKSDVERNVVFGMYSGRIPGGHGANFGSPQRRADWPDNFAETVAWLERYLRGSL